MRTFNVDIFHEELSEQSACRVLTDLAVPTQLPDNEA